MISVKHITKTYGRKQNAFVAIDDASFKIPNGKSVAILGKSGSGKSTLMHAMSGLDRPEKGQVIIDGRDILTLKSKAVDAFRATKMSFIFQSFFVQANEAVPPAPYKAYWTLDTDTCTLGDPIVLKWLAWKWPAAKGFEYAEEFNAYERMVQSLLSRDDAPTRIDMSGSCNDLRPGIWVPAGNWNVP